MWVCLMPKTLHLKTKPFLQTFGQPQCPELEFVLERHQNALFSDNSSVPAPLARWDLHQAVSRQYQGTGGGCRGGPEPIFSSKIL